MELVRIPSQKWSFNAVLRGQGEEVRIPIEVIADVHGKLEGISEFNERIRESKEGFAHYINRFENDQEVMADIRIEKGHRCVLAGTVADRPEDEALNDVIWTACAEWANFQPVLGQSRIHQEKLWTRYEFTHVFEEGTIAQTYRGATEFQKMQMDRFVMGISKFGQAFEWHPHADSEPPKRADYYAYRAAASRRFRVSDGPELWSQGAGDAPHQVNSSTGPVQFGGRVFGGPGEVGTGLSVSAPD
jgi:hypothetical protein